MKWNDISENAKLWMRELGNFGPTHNAAEKMVKGCTLDNFGDAVKIYYDSDNLRQMAKACIEVADWLDARAKEEGTAP